LAYGGRRNETIGARMHASQVTDAWLRIEQWLAAKAPHTHASLRAGANAAKVADAQRRLGLRFPDDLVASLQRHDGCEPSRGHFTLAGPFRPVAVADMTERHKQAEEVLAEFEGYWDRHLLEFAATNTDWGLVTSPGHSRAPFGARRGGDGNGTGGAAAPAAFAAPGAVRMDRRLRQFVLPNFRGRHSRFSCGSR
jgi:hypothetical protein